MKFTIWDFFAPFYELAMKSQKNQYNFLYDKISTLVKGKTVLELATGPGMIAKHISSSARKIIATDFSQSMIDTAEKKKSPENLTFEVADATNLRFVDNSFEVVIIANALHIMPQPEKALSQIKRVLKDDGILIAPNFIDHDGQEKQNLWARFLEFIGVKFEHKWNADEYKAFLRHNGFIIQESAILKGRINMFYAVCKIDQAQSQAPLALSI
ncbi:class I SAM-dependent methyltransferase [Treponema sp.]|uniref:class I SAM-dependent methyltransferase n=1 Tax=Treponema sp. TaxID=166 RepID=UPI0025D27CD2|nr:class I SAM-dependent methyltransferase [Treponema sp.]MCR5217042.1 class I SAM-dependent methyltransferase [Treponema sp.]